MAGGAVVRDGNSRGRGADDGGGERGGRAINAEWTAGDHASARTLFTDLEAGGEPASPHDDAGRIAAQYTIAYIAHAPLEPRAALAEWQGDSLTVWTGTQRPFGVQQETVDALHLPANRVRVIVPDTGSAYGGKHTGDAAVEAARLARAAKKPVKLVWTREEEFWWAYFRPAGVIDVSGAASADGTLTSGNPQLQFDLGLATPQSRQSHGEITSRSRRCGRVVSRARGHREPFRARIAHGRSAHAAHLDPLAFRLKNLENLRQRVAGGSMFGWSTRKKSIDRFLACLRRREGGTTACAEVEVSNGAVEIRRSSSPSNAAPSSTRMASTTSLRRRRPGLGGALFEAIDFEDGRPSTALLELSFLASAMCHRSKSSSNWRPAVGWRWETRSPSSPPPSATPSSTPPGSASDPCR